MPKTRLPPLNALRAFEAAARHRNFRLAAEELGVTQGAVAQHVRALEADLKTGLFDRLPRTLALTDHGRRYSSQLARAFALITEATAGIRPEPQRLTISVTPTFAAKWLIPRLPEFSQAHPEIELRIVASDVLANFQTDGVDVAVRQGRSPFGPGLVAELLFHNDVIAVCSPRLLPPGRSSLGPAELEQLTLLEDGHELWQRFLERMGSRRSVRDLKRISFNQTTLSIEAAISGQGVALGSRFLVDPDIANGRLVQAIDMSLVGELGFHVVAPQKPRQPKPCEVVWNWLIASAKPAPLQNPPAQ